MGNLDRVWQRMNAELTSEFDQKSTLAYQLLTEFCEHGTPDQLQDIINHFATDERLAISLMGVLAQVGFCALGMHASSQD